MAVRMSAPLARPAAARKTPASASLAGPASSRASPAPLVRMGSCLSGLALAATLAAASPALATRSDFGVYFVSPADGSSSTSPVELKMGVKGLDVKPAAEGLTEGTGHHHLLVDGANFVKAGEEIPFDATHLHFGKGQTSASVALPPGRHTLTLQFANALHKSYGKGYAKVLHVTVTN